jgi:hypothetical protein
MWKKSDTIFFSHWPYIITVTLFFFHIDPTFYSLNVECLCIYLKGIIWKLKGKWHFGATFIDNAGKNVIGCIYLMNISMGFTYSISDRWRMCTISYSIPNFPFNFQIKILILECRWPSFFIFFYLEGHITRKFTLKNKKKSMDKKFDTPSTTGTRRSMNNM